MVFLGQGGNLVLSCGYDLHLFSSLDRSPATCYSMSMLKGTLPRDRGGLVLFFEYDLYTLNNYPCQFRLRSIGRDLSPLHGQPLSHTNILPQWLAVSSRSFCPYPDIFVIVMNECSFIFLSLSIYTRNIGVYAILF